MKNGARPSRAPSEGPAVSVNVTCDKCGKRYVISDDKVVGKASVKIRCKQCQNLISVTVTAAPAAQAPAAQADRKSVV